MPTVVVGLPSEVDSALAFLVSKTPTGRVRDPASKIIGEILKDNSMGITPVSGGSGGTTGISSDWPIYIANTPNGPDNIMTLFDTEGLKQGRIMIGGQTVKRPGVQVQIRSNDYLIGYDKANAIVVSLSERVRNKNVTISSNRYVVFAISITSGPISLGKEIQESKRYVFTVNVTVALVYNP